jgi:hypothetical protein
MAKDRSGRPIPAYIPPPPDRTAEVSPQQEQFILSAQKADAAMLKTDELEARVARLEVDAGERFTEALADFEERFNEMMLAQMQELTKQAEMLTKQINDELLRLQEREFQTSPEPHLR